jgi:4-amino-4-deoxy-L-arabinose transferase-like glycosyltransferase
MHAPLTNAVIDIVIPVYNEERALPESIAKLDAYLEANFPYTYRISIADNGSIDDTWEVAQTLESVYPSVRAVHLDKKGRGCALKYIWNNSDADVLAYMDVDLSTDLSALAPMITPLVNGEAAIGIGSRLQKDSKVTRGFKREAISRCYNYILRAALRFKSSDAQCGFKAIRADVAKELLPETADNAWFFDTELLARAERKGLHVHEVPVTWHEDTDSRVKLVKTAADDLRGVLRLRREFSTRPLWEKRALAAILVGTALLYWIGASKNGYGNSFYAAAVQAGTHSWKAFFFGSLDAANYITVDKPPVALWFMEISTRIFGFHAWSMMLPEVLAGVGTVYLVYASVRRWFSAHSALLAAAVMVLTPVAVLMFGFNNPDAVLTLLLTASAYAALRALENIRPVRWLSLAAILTGFAFNTKMMQGLIVVPVLGLTYLIAAQPKLLTRVKHLLVAGSVLLVAALWWPVAVSLTPATSRPYIGSSSDNSIWNLIEGYNGIGRLLGTSSGQGGGGAPGGAIGGNTTTQTPPTGSTSQSSQQPSGSNLPSAGQGMGGGAMQGAGGGRSGPGGTGFGESTGILRMFNSDFGPNIAWFIPLGLTATGLALWQKRRAKRTDQTRAAFMIWGGYLVLHIIVFSMVSGVIHPYYPIVMAPAVAALVGMGVPMLLDAYRGRRQSAFLLPIAVALTAITACILLSYQSWLPWLRWVILATGLSSAIGLLLHLVQPMRSVKALLIAAAIACSIAPAAYALDTATVVHTGSIPSAGPTGTGMSGSNNESASAETAFVGYLLAHQGNAKWIVAVDSANTSAAIQISSGQPVMAVGGFNGSDNALTVEELKQLVASGKLRYYAVSSGGQGMGGGMGNSTILTWVKAHGTVVSYGGTSYTLYDLK